MARRGSPILTLVRPLWIDDNFDPAIAFPPGRRAIGDDRVVGGVPDHKELLGLQS